MPIAIAVRVSFRNEHPTLPFFENTKMYAVYHSFCTTKLYAFPHHDTPSTIAFVEGPCGHCCASVEGGLRNGREPAETPRRVREDVPE